ncbi:hypothetical protein NHQ30_006392 [Ciborinia camelliae]|nr:hypothetical protein NHQ30_006392 [Ciborinia camelliae]
MSQSECRLCSSLNAWVERFFASVGHNVIDNQFVKRPSSLPEFEPSIITEGGATSFLSSLPANLRETGLIEYNDALQKVLQIGLILSCIIALSVAMLEWKSVLKKGSSDAENTDDAGEKQARVPKQILGWWNRIIRKFWH